MWSRILNPAMEMLPFWQSNVRSGVTVPRSSAVDAVITLNVEPGSYWSTTARLRLPSAVASP